jgi:hypothetical protein
VVRFKRSPPETAGIFIGLSAQGSFPIGACTLSLEEREALPLAMREPEEEARAPADGYQCV